MIMILRFIFISLFIFSNNVSAGWLDSAKEKITDATDEVKQEAKQKNSKNISPSLSSKDITKGLKEALSKGADYAVNNLGKTDGFWKNKKVRIPMPESLSKVEKALRKTGQEKYADEFVVTMNRAAEAAVPLTLNIIKASIKNLSIDDAKKILKGPDDAATQHLEKSGGKQLATKISPIVKQATNKTGVTKSYKKLYEKMGFMGKYMKPEDYDIDAYITRKTLDGLFVMIRTEEKKIRDNPLERTSDILKNVFSSLD
jgi:hypothetical protein